MDLNALYLRTIFWINDWLKGSPIGRHYRSLRRFDKLSYQECQNYQLQKLAELLHHAQQNTSFYARYDSNNLSDYPVMDKRSLIDNHDDIAVLPHLIPRQKGAVHIQSTSGSTGTPFSVPQDTNKRLRRIAELKYFGEKVGFKSHEKLIQLRTWNRWQSKSKSQSKKENIIPFDISKMGDNELSILCQLINSEKAFSLRGYASSLDLIAKYAESHPNKFPSLSICISGSEMLHDDTRMRVKKYLGCEIISQYADEECGIIAQERIPSSATDNPMYFNNASYIVEILKLDSDEPADIGELGRIVLTDLYNYAFPIIRYDTGDTAIILSPDKYSNGFPIIGKLFGRRFDICYDSTGNPIHPLTIGRILKHFDKIIQWQFIQQDELIYELRLIMDDSVDFKEYTNPIINLLSEPLGKNAIIKCTKVSEIPILKSGKRKPVVNNWTKP